MLQLLTPVIAELTPEEIGRLSGKAFAILLILAGLVKCLQISRRPTTSALCVSSLACVLSAWALSVVQNSLEQTPLRLAVFSIVFTIILLTGLILGIIGLIDYRRQGNFIQGKAQAIWGVLLSSSLLALIAGVAIQTIMKQEALVGEIASEDQHSSDSLTDFRVEGGPNYFEDLNFRFEKPGSKWVSLSVKQMNPIASVAYMRAKPQIWFMVIAEKIGIENAFDNESLAQVAQANLRAGASSVRVKAKHAEQINGVAGLRFEADAVVNQEPLSYSTWVASINGYAYQLTAFSRTQDRDKLANACSDICNRFHLIDPDRISHAQGVDRLEKHRSESWGYEVDFSSDPGWVYLPEESKEVNAADFVGMRTIDGYQVNFGVVPIELPSQNVDSRELLAIMAGKLFNFQSISSLRPKVVELDSIWFEGAEISGAHSSSVAQFGYRMQLLTNENRGYLLAGWWAPECLNADARIKQVMEKIKLFEPQDVQESLTELQSKARGLLLNEVGIEKYAKGKHKQAAKYFEASLKHMSTDVNIIENLINAYFDDQKLDEAESTLRKYQKTMPENLELSSLHAAILRHQEKFQESKQVYEKLFMDGHDNEEDLHSYLTLASADEEYRQCIAVLEEFTKSYPSTKSKRWLAVFHGRNGDHEKAIRQMLEITRKNKSDLDSLYVLGEVYEQAGQFGAAIEVSERVLEKEPDDLSVYLLKGRCEFELEQYPAAQESFEKVFEQFPENEEAKQYQQYLSALLGKGDRSQISKALEPVPVPELVEEQMKRVESVESVAREDGYDSAEIYKVIGISYEKDDHRRITTYRKFKVNTQAGVETMSTLTRSFDPLLEQVYVNRLAVYDTSGKLVAEGVPEDYYVLDDAGGSQASQDRRVHIPVPNLKPGYSVEQAITYQLIGEPDDFGYENQFLVGMHPMRLGVVYFQGDISKIVTASERVEANDPSPNLRVWHVESPQTFELESQQPRLEKFLPYVRISDAGASWEEVGQEYLEKINPKLNMDEETQALAKRLVSGLSSNNEKIAKLARHVQSECTYKALEFGVRSQIPNTASEVRRNGYGDCKDHSVLLMQLLNAAGIEAHLSLINSGGEVTESLPSLSQFNHMIVCVITKGGTLYLDATEKYTTPMIPKTPGLEDKWTLVLDPEKPELKRTPAYRWAEGQVEIQRQVTLEREPAAEAADFGIRETISFNPYCSRGLRQYLQAFAARDRREAIRDLLAEVERIRIKKFVVENLNQPTKNLVLNLEYDIPRALDALDGVGNSQQFVGNVPAIWEKYLLEVSPDDRRVTPMELTLPLAVTSRMEFRLPSDLGFINSKKFNRREKSQFLEWKTDLAQQGETLVLQSVIRRNSGVLAPGQFEQYWEVSQKAVSAVGGSIRLGRN